MYHVTVTGLTATLLYLFSYLLYKSGIFTLKLHRKLWNIVLAATFIFTALAGIILALQINYRWDIPAIESILKWHVETGIGLAFAGLFHITWHLSYYLSIFRKEEEFEYREQNNDVEILTDFSINLFIIGFVSTSVQLLLLKEIMNITGGYELIVGAFLSSWLIGSAAGSAVAAKSSLSDHRRINLMFSIAPVVSLIILVLFSRLLLKQGETPSFLVAVLYTVIVLIPFCLISGFSFIKLLSAAHKTGRTPGESFSVETAGGIVAGIVIVILSAGILNTYQSLLLIILLSLSYTLLTFYISQRSFILILKACILAISILLIASSPDLIFRQLLMRGVHITKTKDTPYGNITEGEYQGKTSIYYNQRLLSYNDDSMESEEDIHYCMLQVNNHDTVLLISGPLSSRLMEINKYEPRKVIYIENDPALIEMTDSIRIEYPSLLETKTEDAFSYLKRTDIKFNAVIILLPPPSSLSLNRYYTVEFFKAVKDKMRNGGVFSCSPGINPNYLNKESLRLYSSIYNSLNFVFKNVIPISGNKLYFLASDTILTTSICQLVQRRNIENAYVGPDYLFDDLIGEKSRELISTLDSNVKMNSLNLPIACFYFQSFSLSKKLGEKIPSIILLATLFAFTLRTVHKETSIMYFSALALAGYEILLLIMLQTAAGNMYQTTGVVLAGILTGLSMGAGVKFRFVNDKIYPTLFLLCSLYILIALASGRILQMNNRIVLTGLLVISGFFPAFLTGNFFRNLTLDYKSDYNVSRIYSADLAGSSVGFIIFSSFIIPLVGISVALSFLSVLIFIGYLLSAIGRRSLFY